MCAIELVERHFSEILIGTKYDYQINGVGQFIVSGADRERLGLQPEFISVHVNSDGRLHVKSDDVSEQQTAPEWFVEAGQRVNRIVARQLFIERQLCGA